MKPTATVTPPAPAAAPVSALKKTLMNIGIGGTAGTIAISTVYPLETVKTIIQMQSEAGSKATFAKVVKERAGTEGLGTLYRGLPAACCRQFFFASLRIGLFYNYSDYIKSSKHRPMTLLESTIGSLATGAIGISAVMPFDVIFVRFQADTAVPVAQRRGYTSLGNAMSRIIKEEGAGTLWRGIIPAIGRAMALNLGMLVPYEKCKAFFQPTLGYTRTNYLLSSAIAGFGASFCSLPFDNAKVKMQKMKAGPDGKMPYKGLFDCMVKTAKKEGVRGLWAGFLPFYAVIAPHSMLTLIISDALRVLLGVSTH